MVTVAQHNLVLSCVAQPSVAGVDIPGGLGGSCADCMMADELGDNGHHVDLPFDYGVLVDNNEVQDMFELDLLGLIYTLESHKSGRQR